MLGLNPGRIVRVETLSEVKNETYMVTHAMVKMLTGVIGFLILVTSLGIVGLTSSSVTQRIRQIGTRRALGATKGDIVRYFLVENGVITGFGLVFGIALASLTVALEPEPIWQLVGVVANLKAFSEKVKQRPSSLLRNSAAPDRRPGEGMEEVRR